MKAALAAVLYWAILVSAGFVIGTMLGCAHKDMSRETSLGITELLKQELNHP